MPAVRAADGVMAGTRDAMYAWRAGVTRAVSAPVVEEGRFGVGLSVYLDLGAGSMSASVKGMEKGRKGVIKEVGALHVGVSYESVVSVSEQIAGGLFLGGDDRDVLNDRDM